MFHALANKRGFTLTELLVAMGLSAIVMAAIGYMYHTQQKSYLVQENLAAAQQNLRSAMYFMEREIRMAGCDPTQNANPKPGILTANNNTINFTLDITNTAGTGNPDGLVDGPNENVTYSLGDGDGDGDNDLLRTGNLLAENIDALDFVYLNSAGTPTATFAQIQSVQVTIVARTGRADPGYTDTNDYRNQQGTIILAAQNDRFRRKQLDTTIKLRNPRD
ncbi:MAG: PilW family protein [Deltaproteobacteria bacterium]|nr:PilW family protein [Deltaproteobacteria bacterium]